MGNKVTLVRPDGSKLYVSPEDATTLRTLGYKDETPEHAYSEAVNASTEEYYTRPGQVAKTAAEGLLGGATVGLSDLAFDAAGFDTAERAGYNPGTRLGTEIIGSLAPALLSGGAGAAGAAARLTPAGLLTSGAAGIGEAVGGSAVRRLAVAGAVEGAGFGLGAELSNAKLTGDPLTTESVLAGVGWGALWGGGLGAITGGVVARGEAKAALAAQEAAAEETRLAASQAREAHLQDAWTGLRSSMADASDEVSKTIKGATAQVDTAKTQVKSVHQRAVQATDEAASVRNDFFNELSLSGVEKGLGGKSTETLVASKKAGIKAFNEMKSALKARNYEGVEKAQLKFQQSVDNINKVLDEAGTAVSKFPGQSTPVDPALRAPTMVPFSPAEQLSVDTAKAGLKEMGELGKAQIAFRSMPVNVEMFAKMTPASAEKAFGAVDTFLKTGSAEFNGMRESLKGGIAKMQESLGLAIDGSPATQLRGVYETLRLMGQKKGVDAAASATGKVPWLSKRLNQLAGNAGGRAASQYAAHMGGGGLTRGLAYDAGRTMAIGLLGLKAAVVGGMTEAVTKWAPKALVKTQRLQSRIEPLYTRLDGTVDKSTKNRDELMKLRATEIREAAGSVRDTLYKNLSPLAEDHPDLAASMHAHAVKRYQFILDKLPKDPGLAFSRLQSLWKPDALAVEKFSRYYEVFHNPVGVVNKILDTGRVHAEWAEGLREMDPALFAHLRVEMLNRISDPAVMKKLDYPQLVGMGTLLDLKLHSTMTPQFVATQMQMYVERNQQIPMPPQPGASGGGGRPPGPANSKGATSAQKITEH